MADIAKDAGIEPDASTLEGISRLTLHLWQEVWKHGDRTAAGNTDALHDMRVAIRRLRSLLQNFEGSKNAPVLSAKLRREFREHRSELGKLGDALGAVRDFDVLDEYLKEYADEQLKAPLDGSALEYSGLVAFKHFLQDERAAVFAPMVKRINKSRRADGLQEEFARWALGLPAASAPPESLREVAHRLLAIRVDEIVAHAPSLEATHAEEEQHEFRKSLRRLRYTFETLGPCFTSDTKPHVKTLVQLQDLLGEMQDRAVLQAAALHAFSPNSGSTPGKNTVGESTPEDLPEGLPEDVAAFLQFGSARRVELLEQVQALWKKHEKAKLVENLRAL